MPIEDNLNANEALLNEALIAVNSNIASLVARLESDNNGRFLSDTLSLQQALNMRVEIATAMAPYNDAVDAVTASYIEAAKDAAADAAALGINEAFSQADADLIDAMMANTRAVLIAAGVDVSGRLSEQMYLAVASGGSKADMIETVRQFTLGKTDKRGKPLANHAVTIANDAYMGIDSLVTMRIAENNNLDKFMYQGTLISDSRPWCVSHLNKILTREEIRKWDGQQWAGKKSGDSFIVRGGHQCRHHWRIVVSK